jgi:hypothetical protein
LFDFEARLLENPYLAGFFDCLFGNLGGALMEESAIFSIDSIMFSYGIADGTMTASDGVVEIVDGVYSDWGTDDSQVVDSSWFVSKAVE